MTTYQHMSHLHTESPTCRYCGAYVHIVPELTPRPESWHSDARCVEGDEPSYKMGGPA
jgi:hypothetical protein